MEVMKTKITKIIKIIQEHLKKPEFYIPFIGSLFGWIIIQVELYIGLHNKLNIPMALRDFILSLDIFIFPITMLILWPFYLIIKKNQNINRVLYAIYYAIFCGSVYTLPRLIQNYKYKYFIIHENTLVFPLLFIIDLLINSITFFIVFYLIIVASDVIIQVIIKVFNYIKSLLLK